MAHVVFFRAANVGGRNVFRPSELVRSLAPLEVVNVGAAGTLVVRGRAPAAVIRRSILARLPFQPVLVIVPAKEAMALARRDPFRGTAFSKDLRGWIAALEAKPAVAPELPVESPAGRAWSVRLERVEGAFALGTWRRQAGAFTSPGAVVERALGVAATARWWETLVRVAAVLERAE